MTRIPRDKENSSYVTISRPHAKAQTKRKRRGVSLAVALGAGFLAFARGEHSSQRLNGIEQAACGEGARKNMCARLVRNGSSMAPGIGEKQETHGGRRAAAACNEILDF